MSAQTWVSLATIIIAVTIPYLSYKLTTRHEHRKWLREQRLEAYTNFVEILHRLTAHVSAKGDDFNMLWGLYGFRATRVQLIASQRIGERYIEFDQWIRVEVSLPLSEDLHDEYDARISLLIDAMRAELGSQLGSVGP